MQGDVATPFADRTLSPDRGVVPPEHASLLRSLLVHVDAGPHCVTRLRTARQIADAFGATLTAYYAATPLIATSALAGEATAAASIAPLLAEVDRSWRELALSRVEALRAEPGAPVAWQEAQGVDPIGSLARRALYADLLVMGQRSPEISDCGIPGNLVESVLIESGGAALVLPYVQIQQTLGQRILLAWKETPSSARAVRAALPFMQRAREVHVVFWGTGEHDVSAANAITAFLQHHGIQSRLSTTRKAPDEVGECLLSHAADVSADMLVMGCYGHSRARELVLGGATRTILQSMTLPVLMAH
jgi:nucleotide-binding universal stress UspA family protein